MTGTGLNAETGTAVGMAITTGGSIEIIDPHIVVMGRLRCLLSHRRLRRASVFFSPLAGKRGVRRTISLTLFNLSVRFS